MEERDTMILLLRGTLDSLFRVQPVERGQRGGPGRVRSCRYRGTGAARAGDPAGMVRHLGPALLARVST